MKTDVTAPVTKSALVARPPHDAFRLWTEGIDSWWPVDSHSLGAERVAEVVFEPGEGGRVFERWHDGTTHEWGRVETWDPPHVVGYSWQPNPDSPGKTEIEVRFSSEGEGTRVQLTHSYWERLGKLAAETRESYRAGWDLVLGRYLRSLETR